MISIGVLTISDSGAKGAREDTSGERIRAMVTQLSEAVLSAGAIIPDEREQIEATLREWSDEKQVNLILTTGGTGLAPRDVTPQATLHAIDYEVPGIAEAMRNASLQVTPAGMLSRAVAGVRRGTLIINLPGNPKAVRENLGAIAAALPHAVGTLRGEVGEHTRPQG